ncbi:MAG: hypothetical protein AUH16_06480 [Acidobacteria bacterium 13_2_20CM_57_7]|nr:MAG: hypothetical protein AUH16_06480 [Acidobacteria bacterium 13_2_20CM_57_7]
MTTLPPNEQLKDLRSRLGITTRDVAEFSQRIAEAEGNPEFQISNAWLTQIENSDSVPSIFKLYSLSAIYRMKFTDLLRLYGLDLQRLGLHQLAAPLPHTHLTTLEVYDADRTVSFPIRFDRSFELDNTNLLSRMVETSGTVNTAMSAWKITRSTPCCAPVPSCRSIHACGKCNLFAGGPNLTAPFISWSCATAMLAPGVTFWMTSSCCFLIPCHPATCENSSMEPTPRSSGR